MRQRSIRVQHIALSAAMLGGLSWAAVGRAQLQDVTRIPNAENEGIQKSYEEQIGAGRGDVFTPGSSSFIIKRDSFRAIRRGRQIFQRKFAVSQGFTPLTNDGTGFIEGDASIGAGLVDSCAGCHGRPRGSAGSGGNVFTRPDSRDAPHLFGLGLQEMLADEITTDLRDIQSDALADAEASGTAVTRALQSKGIAYGSITANPDGTVDTSNVVGVDADLRVRPFFAQGGTISIREFTVGAFNAEMGLEAPDPDLLTASSGGMVVTPSGMVLDGSIDAIESPPVTSEAEDGDGDGVVNEVPTSIVDFTEFYLLNYFKPGRHQETFQSLAGRAIFNQIGCASCHKANLTVERDRRVADVETVFDAEQGIFNRLFATATPLFEPVDDESGFPAIKEPLGGEFVVRNFFADLKRHDLGSGFHELNFDGTFQREFMTEALWGAGTTAPYGHDGRSINLEEVILRHGGEAQAARNNFANLPIFARRFVEQFLQSLVLFPPDDTASNLNPGDPSAPDFPQRGHGSIALGVLFNDPSESE